MRLTPMLCLTLCAWLAAPAPARDLAIDRAASILFDNHASSADKQWACRTLEFRGRAAQIAALGLVRQTRYNIEPVRDAARTALIQVVGKEKAAQLLDLKWTDQQLYDAFSSQWLATLRDWPDLRASAEFLRRPNPHIRELGLRGMEKLSIALQWDIRGRTRHHLSCQAAAEALAEYDRHDPSGRHVVLDVFYRLGVDGIERPLVRIALRAAVDYRPGMIQRGKSTLDRLVPPNESNPAPISGLVDAALWEEGRVALEAHARLQRVSAWALSFASAQCIAEAIDRGHPSAHAMLRRWHTDPDTFARAAKAPPGIDARAFRDQIAEAHPAVARAHGRATWRELLASDNPHLRDLALKLLLPPGDSQFDLLIEAINAGVPVHESLLRELPAQDRPEFFARILPTLKSPHQWVVLAGLHALWATGYKGNEVNDLLNTLLRRGSPDVRDAAARVIGTDQAKAAVRVPELLSQLRSDAPAIRSQAARELHELATDQEKITRALIAAVDQRDLLVREGLTLALERAHANGSKALDILKDLSKSTTDPATRAYVKAALKAVEGQ
jgi:hypothetical protein